MHAHHTFETFHSYDGNRFALEAARAIVLAPETALNPLVFYGPHSTGKTHLLHAIENLLRSWNPNMKIAALNTDEFISYLLQGLMRDRMDHFYAKFHGADYFLLDDLHLLDGKESSQLIFCDILQQLMDKGTKIVLTTSIHPDTFAASKTPLPDIPSFSVFPIALPDAEACFAIAHSKAKDLGLRLEDELLHFICSYSSNARQIEGFLRRILAYRDFQLLPFTTENLKNALLKDAP